MPTYTITDPDSGRKIRVSGDSPPTEDELSELFGSTPLVTPKPTIAANEPTSYSEGFRKSLADTGVRTLTGVVKGIGSALDPRNLPGALTSLAGMAIDPRRAGEAIGKPIGETLRSTAQGVRGLITGDDEAIRESLTTGVTPEGGGEVIGGLLAGKALPILPRAIRRVPSIIEATGSGLERAGRVARGASPYGIAHAALTGNPVGLAAAAAPYVVQGAGRVISRTGRALRPRATLTEAAGLNRYMPNTSASPVREFAEPAARFADDVPVESFGPATRFSPTAEFAEPALRFDAPLSASVPPRFLTPEHMAGVRANFNARRGLEGLEERVSAMPPPSRARRPLTAERLEGVKANFKARRGLGEIDERINETAAELAAAARGRESNLAFRRSQMPVAPDPLSTLPTSWRPFATGAEPAQMALMRELMKQSLETRMGRARSAVR